MMENTWYRGKLCSKLPRNYDRNSVCYFCILTRFFSIPFIVASASRGTSMRLAFDYMSVPLWFRPIRQAHQAESAAYQLDPQSAGKSSSGPGPGRMRQTDGQLMERVLRFVLIIFRPSLQWRHMNVMVSQITDLHAVCSTAYAANKAHNTGPLGRGGGGGGFPSQRAYNAENVPCNDVIIYNRDFVWYGCRTSNAWIKLRVSLNDDF